VPRPLQRLVYAQHGRDLRGVKSTVRASPCSQSEETGRTRRRQLREGDRPWTGRRSASLRAYEQPQPIRPTGQVRWHHTPKPSGPARGSMLRLCRCRARSDRGRPPDQATRVRGAARRAPGVVRVEEAAAGRGPPRPRRAGLHRSGARRPPTRAPRPRARMGKSRGRRVRRGSLEAHRPISWSRASPGTTCGSRGTG
jgi:hypothetical protein